MPDDLFAHMTDEELDADPTVQMLGVMLAEIVMEEQAQKAAALTLDPPQVPPRRRTQKPARKAA